MALQREVEAALSKKSRSSQEGGARSRLDDALPALASFLRDVAASVVRSSYRAVYSSTNKRSCW
jgi:hypothetical protein